jgi:DNA-binding HxlR family transcriptional regulator
MEDGTSKSLGSPRGTDLPGICDTQACELRDLLDRLADKWSLLVVELLGHGTHRFTELRRHIDGISQRMLTVTLRQLERDGLVRRTVYPVIPPRVDYQLTPLGGTLLEQIQPLVAWTRAHRADIAAARAEYDAQEQRVSAHGSVRSTR